MACGGCTLVRVDCYSPLGMWGLLKRAVLGGGTGEASAPGTAPADGAEAAALRLRPAGIGSRPLVCRFGRSCLRVGCYYQHPAGRLMDEQQQQQQQQQQQHQHQHQQQQHRRLRR